MTTAPTVNCTETSVRDAIVRALEATRKRGPFKYIGGADCYFIGFLLQTLDCEHADEYVDVLNELRRQEIETEYHRMCEPSGLLGSVQR